VTLDLQQVLELRESERSQADCQPAVDALLESRLQLSTVRRRQVVGDVIATAVLGLAGGLAVGRVVYLLASGRPVAGGLIAVSAAAIVVSVAIARWIYTRRWPEFTSARAHQLSHDAYQVAAAHSLDELEAFLDAGDGDLLETCQLLRSAVRG
jgi:hypothetical protein